MVTPAGPGAWARRHEAALVATALLIASLFPLWAAAREASIPLHEDSYITLTYAKNLASGRGFIYNHPPPVLGTTTPLFTLVLAALAAALPGVPMESLAVAVSGACWAGTAWILYLARAGFRLPAWQAGVVGLVILSSGWVQMMGMEAFLFACLLVASVALFFRGWPFACGVVTGLLFLTRGEGALLAALLWALAPAAAWAAGERRAVSLVAPAIRLGAGFWAVVAVWSAYALAVFGSPLSNTLAAKIAQAGDGTAPQLVQVLLAEWLPRFSTQFAPAGLPLLNAWWFLVIAGFTYAVGRKRRWLVFAAWLALYVAGYSILGVAVYWWYQLPVIFVLQLYAGLGLAACLEALAGLHRVAGLPRAALALGAVLFIVLGLSLPRIQAVVDPPDDGRATNYKALARWVRENTQPEQSVAYVEIGYLGYFTENRIVDLMGLVTPDVVPHMAQGDYAWGFWRYRPDYFIYTRHFDWVLESIHADPRLNAEYRPVATLPGFAAGELIIYRRVAP